ncbi:MAG TPA: site-specific integrase [Bacteroidetes bacterium]|nr:transposase from transposon Tn916 [bacterium BMS3Bbin04]HDO66347.1 site-specific integrase [Bacteroidota bacterium]HEX05472.1 site-specific integrase [Bacteroidota bacterium]
MATIRKRTTRDGSVSYHVQIRKKGFPTETTSFSNLTHAKRWANQTETDMDEGRYFRNTEAKRHTVEEAIDRYLKEVLPRYKDQAKPLVHLRFWKERIGHMLLSELKTAKVVQERDRLLRDDNHPGAKMNRSFGPATANRYTTSLSRVLSVCARDWGWLEQSPMRGFRKLKETRGRVRYLSDDERARILAVCQSSSNPDLYLAVILALSTGARRSELWNLRWSQIDLAGQKIILDETKNDERRVLPIFGKAHELLTERSITQRRLDTDLLFPGRTNPKIPQDLTHPWQRAIQEAKIVDFRWHDLRHSAASYLAMSGATPTDIAAILGHKTLQMVKRYAHLSEPHTASVVERMNKKFMGES